MKEKDQVAGVVVTDAEIGPGALMVQEELPERMCVFPLRRAVPFPNLMMPILLDSQRSREIVAKAEAQNGYLFLVAQKDPEEEEPRADGLYEVGVIARILKTLKLPDGNESVMCQGLRRGAIARFVRKKPHLIVKTKVLIDIPSKGRRARAVSRRLRQALGKVVNVSDDYGEDLGTAVLNIDQPDQLADFAGSYFLKQTDQRQQILEALDINKRLDLAFEFVVTELELAELGNRIQEEIRSKVEKAQKDYFLREQLRIIRRELGEEQDAREMEIARIEQAIESAGLPEVAQARAREELSRLKTTPVESAEYSVLRNYLDWLTGLPWSVATKDSRDLRRSQRFLDEDHYGLEDVKSRILEFLAVRKLKPNHQGSILCLSGPPGVGKTSLGQSIARAMERRFWRFSLGGMRDEAEIKGHRRTYIGAMPGRILQGIKTCGSNNPVIMLDEVDKLGADFRGDPSSALLEVLDPEQNHAFLDHYLDVPFDLSKVMFIATANALPQIPQALRDRMEVIELPGYLTDEKVQIGRRHLVPKQLERHGLTRSDVSFSEAVIRRIVDFYTSEAGVRSLEKNIVRICRKTAFAVARRNKKPGRLQIKGLTRLLGQPRHAGDGDRSLRVPGVVQGLAWTSHGGEILFIEAASASGKGDLQLTGSLGDVMSESARLALSFLRSHAAEFELDPKAFGKQDVHVHFPAGAIPKDGPSAGISIACALVSLMRGIPVPRDVAMTGELTLVGEILPIGGVREKVVAARRAKIKRVILPEENRRDVEELKPYLIKGLEFIYVATFGAVSEAVFGRLD